MPGSLEKNSDRRDTVPPKRPLTFPTRSDLPEETRDASVAILNGALADATDLFTQVKYAHWNVKGPEFIALHELSAGSPAV